MWCCRLRPAIKAMIEDELDRNTYSGAESAPPLPRPPADRIVPVPWAERNAHSAVHTLPEVPPGPSSGATRQRLGRNLENE
jgi:hypothetical protein